MTNGVVVVLGSVGWNFAAGMTGGEAFVLDKSNVLVANCNQEFVSINALSPSDDAEQIKKLKKLIEQHAKLTQSEWSQQILENFDYFIASFKYVSVLSQKKEVKLISNQNIIELKNVN
jgi:glutamate synthase domain-containing protein 3